MRAAGVLVLELGAGVVDSEKRLEWILEQHIYRDYRKWGQIYLIAVRPQKTKGVRNEENKRSNSFR